MPSSEEFTELNSGLRMPVIGYGTYLTPARETERLVSEALEIGYRSVDTAQCYGNEAETARAVDRSGIPRDDIFVTTKLWGCRGYGDTLRSIDRSLSAMGRIDLLLMHEPMGDFHEVYRAMEAAYKEEKVGSIGVSNFLEDSLRALLDGCDVVPAVNQVETHVFRQQRILREMEAREGIVHESWSPLASGRGGIFGNDVLEDVAEKHGRTVSQVALRFLTQQGIVVIPKSTGRKHMLENLDVQSFDLDADDLERIGELDRGVSLFGWW